MPSMVSSRPCLPTLATGCTDYRGSWFTMSWTISSTRSRSSCRVSANAMAHAIQRQHRENPAFAMPDEVRIMLADTKVSAYATFSSHARPVGHHLTIYGTRNTLRLDFVAGTLTLNSGSTLPGPLGRVTSSLNQSTQHFRASMTSVARLVRALSVHDGTSHPVCALLSVRARRSAAAIAYGELLRLSALTTRSSRSLFHNDATPREHPVHGRY